MIRVGIDATMLEPARTGVGNYVHNLLVGYRKLRPEASLFLFSNRALSEEAKALGECVEHVPTPVDKGPLWMSTGLPPMLRRYGINVFWGGNGYLPIVVPRNVRRVVTIHDLVYLRAADTVPRISRWSRAILQPLAARQADALICVSRSTAREVRDVYGRSADAVMEPQIDPAYKPAFDDELERVRSLYALPERFLLTVGTLEPRKNLAGLLRAYVEARRAGVELPLLVIAGRVGWLSKEIKGLVDDSIGSGFAKFLGYVPLGDMPALYSAAETFIFVPLYEGFGMPAREALMCGTPVIGSDIEVIREATCGAARYIGTSVAAVKAALVAYAEGDRPPRPPAAVMPPNDDAAATFAEILERVGAAAAPSRT